MRTSGLLLGLCLVFVMAGCSREDRNRSANTPAADTKDQAKTDRGITASDQPENEADRKITQEIRQAVVKDDSLSTSAHNVTIVTKNGNVTLRGSVKNDSEKQKITEKAKQIAGVTNIDNQLTVAQ